MHPWQLTAAEARAQIEAGTLTAEALTRACLDRCAAREPITKAFAFLDADLAISNARRVDKAYARGVLHGLPLGVKDMIDTADMPTSHNSPLYEGLRQGRDAACVGVARGEGVVVFGKTDTVEFAAGGRRARRPPARPPRWRKAWCRSPSARRPAAASSARPPSAVCLR